jgi:hypothetical protein
VTADQKATDALMLKAAVASGIFRQTSDLIMIYNLAGDGFKLESLNR